MAWHQYNPFAATQKEEKENRSRMDTTFSYPEVKYFPRLSVGSSARRTTASLVGEVIPGCLLRTDLYSAFNLCSER